MGLSIPYPLKNNSISGGFHNKMEMISRQAYGFRNSESYRLRVRVLRVGGALAFVAGEEPNRMDGGAWTPVEPVWSISR